MKRPGLFILVSAIGGPFIVALIVLCFVYPYFDNNNPPIDFTDGSIKTKLKPITTYIANSLHQSNKMPIALPDKFVSIIESIPYSFSYSNGVIVIKDADYPKYSLCWDPPDNIDHKKGSWYISTAH